MAVNGANNHRDAITATGFLIRLWEERLFLTVAVFICVTLAAVYIVLSPSKYTATALLLPVEPTGMQAETTVGGMPSALSLLGGARQENPKFELFLTVIKTERFGHHLQQKYHFVGSPQSGHVVRSFAQLMAMLHGIVVVQNSASNTAVLSIQLSNKGFAKQFLLAVINEGNAEIRARDSRRAEKLASYVESKFKNETNRAVQDALASLLISQERFLMMTQVDLPYAAEILDGPTVSNRPTSPKKILLLGVGVVAGIFIGLAAVLLWDAAVEERRSRGFHTIGLSEGLHMLPKRIFDKVLGDRN